MFAEAEVECCSCAGWFCHSGWLGIGRSHADSAAEQKRLKIEPASPLPARYITVSVVTLRLHYLPLPVSVVTLRLHYLPGILLLVL